MPVLPSVTYSMLTHLLRLLKLPKIYTFRPWDKLTFIPAAVFDNAPCCRSTRNISAGCARRRCSSTSGCSAACLTFPPRRDYPLETLHLPHAVVGFAQEQLMTGGIGG